MDYEMYQEIMEQPSSLKNTIIAEKEHLESISDKFNKFDKIYLIGCGSSISTCYTLRDGFKTVSTKNIDVQTGFEFVNHQLLEKDSNVGVILTSQSGETSDTRRALEKAKKYNIYTLAITNMEDSSMAKEADDAVITRCGEEHAILGTKTYITQLLCLYVIFYNMIKSERTEKLLDELYKLPSKIEELINTTEESSKLLAQENKDVDLFYCMGSGLNFGLAYKLAMTMFMEGSIKHACPVFSGEFRHGLIERVEEGTTVVFIKSGEGHDDITCKSIDFCEKIGVNSIIFDLKDYDEDVDCLLTPFILLIPLEWFIYHLSIFNGIDPGSTRHIGKVRY